MVGYIGSFPIPEVVMGINAFTIAMQKVKPDTQVKVVWVNSWYDPGKEGDAAKALIDQGADIICQHTDSPAPLQVAQERGVHGFGQASDMKAYAPDAQLTSIIDDWSDYYVERGPGAARRHLGDAQRLVWPEGRHGQDGALWPGGDRRSASRPPRRPEEGIIAGTLHPFDGPVTNQAGEVVIAEGERASDDVLQIDGLVRQGRPGLRTSGRDPLPAG